MLNVIASNAYVKSPDDLKLFLDQARAKGLDIPELVARRRALVAPLSDKEADAERIKGELYRRTKDDWYQRQREYEVGKYGVDVYLEPMPREEVTAQQLREKALAEADAAIRENSEKLRRKLEDAAISKKVINDGGPTMTVGYEMKDHRLIICTTTVSSGAPIMQCDGSP